MSKREDCGVREPCGNVLKAKTVFSAAFIPVSTLAHEYQPIQEIQNCDGIVENHVGRFSANPLVPCTVGNIQASPTPSVSTVARIRSCFADSQDGSSDAL
jgi:hypothetical protein